MEERLEKEKPKQVPKDHAINEKRTNFYNYLVSSIGSNEEVKKNLRFIVDSNIELFRAYIVAKIIPNKCYLTSFILQFLKEHSFDIEKNIPDVKLRSEVISKSIRYLECFCDIIQK